MLDISRQVEDWSIAGNPHALCAEPELWCEVARKAHLSRTSLKNSFLLYLYTVSVMKFGDSRADFSLTALSLSLSLSLSLH